MEFSDKFDMPVKCIIEALEICLNRNCSTYQGKYWLQNDGTAMGPKNSCSYVDIVAEYVDNKVLDSKTTYPELHSWFRFRDDTFVLRRGTVERLNMFFILSTLLINIYNLLWTWVGSHYIFLDLLITIKGNSLVTSAYSKPTDAHLYLDAKSCHPRSQILGIAKGAALRIRIGYVRKRRISIIRVKSMLIV
jgi:hypothetical protein